MTTETPAARWRNAGKDDPHGDRYACEREQLFGGQLTDDELANAVFLEPSIANLTAAKDRIRWLSRQLAATTGWRSSESAPKDGTDVLAWWPGHLVIIARWTGHGRTGGPRWYSAWYDAPMSCDPVLWQPIAKAPTHADYAEMLRGVVHK